MVTSALVQEKGGGRLGPEERDLVAGLRERGIPAELFIPKRLARRQLSLARETLVAGEVPVVLGALGQLGIDPPEPNDYPKCLRHLLHRRIWTSTVRRLTDDVLGGSGPPVFAKPSVRKKRFTGRVFAAPADLYHLEGASGATAVHCSEVVRWASEYRVFVVRGEIVDIRHYGGDPAVTLDVQVASEAVRALQASGEATAGYGLDLGVLDDGQTALVEWNDGYSLGSYGLDPGRYAELILARWRELTS